MAAQIQAPLEIFLELDGTPLENGYIYIGESGKNAEANPITVYWDDAYSIAAAQPIRTIGGYGSNNGIRSNIFVDGFYSIVIKDKNGALVFSGDSILDPDIALGVAEVEASGEVIVADAQDKAWEAEAEVLTADSYATQIEDTFVDEYTSDGDGTFTAIPTTDYSALHWAAKAEASALAADTEAGTYAPIWAIVSNATAITPQITMFTRIGNIVTVTGAVAINQDVVGTAVRVTLSLPVAPDNNFSTLYQVSGVVNQANDGTSGHIFSDIGTKLTEITFLAGSTLTQTFRFVFSYKTDT